MILEKLKQALSEALAHFSYHANGQNVLIETPREKAHGDFYTNAGFVVASQIGSSPLKVAEDLARYLDQEKSVFEKVEVKPPGFINFFLSPELYLSAFYRLLEQGTSFLYPQKGQGEKVLIEFVSANPTGPLHVGNGRGGVIGDVLASILSKCGYAVEKEYYVNDGRDGTQMEKLGISFKVRLQQARGEDVSLPEDSYPGAYLLEMAQSLDREEREVLLQEKSLLASMKKASAMILENQKETLKALGIEFHRFVHEDELLTTSSLVQEVLEAYRSKNFVEEKEGALWLKATNLKEKKDEVLIRRNSKPTYFLTDIVYHSFKFQRGYDRLIDIWGADHHGHIKRMKLALELLGYPSEKLTVLLYQLVRLVEEGEPVKMSKRSGDYFTLNELIEEVGKDATRLFFLSRDCHSPLDFDISLAKKQSLENPAFYIHYAQCRIRSLYRKKEEMGLAFPSFFEKGEARKEVGSWSHFGKEEQEIVKHLLLLESVSLETIRNLEPHRLYFYLLELASLFHAYYQKYPILTAPLPERARRWYFLQAVEKVMLDLFSILGITPLEKM